MNMTNSNSLTAAAKRVAEAAYSHGIPRDADLATLEGMQARLEATDDPRVYLVESSRPEIGEPLHVIRLNSKGKGAVAHTYAQWALSRALHEAIERAPEMMAYALKIGQGLPSSLLAELEDHADHAARYMDACDIEAVEADGHDGPEFPFEEEPEEAAEKSGCELIDEITSRHEGARVTDVTSACIWIEAKRGTNAAKELEAAGCKMAGKGKHAGQWYFRAA